jgi:SnoaL-like domain
MSDVPLAEDLVFRGPVASFDSAEGYRAMARQAGAAVTSFRIRYQVSDGDRVCSVVDWTMQPVPGTRSAAEGWRSTTANRPGRAVLRRRGAMQGDGAEPNRVAGGRGRLGSGRSVTCLSDLRRPGG